MNALHDRVVGQASDEHVFAELVIEFVGAGCRGDVAPRFRRGVDECAAGLKRVFVRLFAGNEAAFEG